MYDTSWSFRCDTRARSPKVPPEANLQIDWVLRRLFHIEQSDQGPNCLSETRRVDSNHELNEKCFMYTLWRSITLNSSLTIV